jgi:hypothetical protein
MKVGPSEIIAFLSFLVAFAAFRHSIRSSKSMSKQIQNISDSHLRLSSNVAFSQASQEYVSLLSEVNMEFEEIVKNLSTPAHEVCIKIGNVFNQFDSEQRVHPYLSDAFDTSISIVSKAYGKELIYQTGGNLKWRINALRFLKDDVVKYKKAKLKKSIFSFLKKLQNPKTPEEIIDSSTDFWNSVETIYDRIPEDKVPELFNKISKHLSEYSQLHNEIIEKLESLERRLEEAIKKNKLEIFNIEAIPNLGKKFYRVKGDIDRYKKLSIIDYHEIGSDFVSDGIAYSICAGSIIFIASKHFMWGKT